MADGWDAFTAVPDAAATPAAVVAAPTALAPDAQVDPWAVFAAPADMAAAATETPAEPPGLLTVQGLRNALAPTPGYVRAGPLPLAVKETSPGSGVMDPNSGIAGAKFDPLSPVAGFVNPLLDLLEGTGLATSAGGQNAPLAGKISPAASALLFGSMVGNPSPFQKTASVMRAPFPGTPDAGMLFAKQNDLLDQARPLIADPQLRDAITAKQAAAAGTDLAATATDLPAAHAVIDSAPAPLIPGDNPTVGKLTLDPGIAAAEYTASRGSGPIQERVTRQQADFAKQISAQNDARVAAIQDIAPTGDIGTVPAELQRQAAAQDAVSAANVAATRTGATGDIEAVDRAGQQRVAAVQAANDAAAATGDAAAQARVGGLRRTADQATTAMGGDLPAGSANDVGAALRAPVGAANQAAWARIHELAAQVDPDGTLGAVATPVRDVANAIDAGRTTYSRELSEPEAKVLDLARAMPDQLRFRDLKEYRSQLTDGMMTARQTGKPTGIYSDLIKGVDDAMNNAVTHQAARDAAAVRAGTMRPEDAISARVRRAVQDADAANRADTERAGGTAGGTPNPGAQQGGGGPASVRGDGNGSGSGGLRPGDRSVAPGPAAQGRAPETLREALIRAGGVKDESGEFKSQDLDRIHHRGGGRLVNPNGMSHDYAREFAVEQGFLPQSATVNDFRDAVVENPVRIDEAADAGLRSQQAREGQITEEAQFASGANIADMASQLGVKLSRAETDHAVVLHMLGADPEDAIRQAAHSGDEAVFQRNAEYNAVGSPGVPIAARQAEMPITDSGPPVVPMDAEAAARYAAYRSAVRDRGATFGDAPGVGQILQPGRFSGDFKVPDTAVPNIIVRVDAAGADVAKAYLKAGGDPAALSQAAAFSLRQHPGVMRADGTLDPSKVEAWAQRRAPFLSVIPETGEKFTAVVRAQRAVDAAVAEEAAGSKARGSAATAALKAAADEARDTLKQVTTIAQQTVDDAVAQRATQIKERQASAIGRFLGDVEPVPALWSILNDKTTGAAKARQLKAAIARDPDAMAGMSRMVGQAIETNLVGVPKGITSEEGAVAANAYQNFIKHAEPALAELLSPGDLGKLKATAEMMARDYRTAQVGVGSSTGQLTAGRGVVGKIGGLLFRNITGAGLGGTIGAWLGNHIGAPTIGANVGVTLGIGIAQLVERAREAGIQNMADLKAAAFLNPSLFRVLTTDATPKNSASLAGALGTQLRRASLVGAVQGNNAPQGNDNRRDAFEPPRNALLH